MANKGMDIMLKIKAKIDKTLPKNMELLANRVKNIKKANEELKNAQRELTKATNLKNNYNESKEKYSKSLLELRKVRTEMKRLEKAKASGTRLSKLEERTLKKLTSQHKKLSETVAKQRNSFQRYRMEIKKLPKSLDEYQRELLETEKRVKSLNAQQTLLNKASNLKNGIKNITGKIASKITTGLKYGAVAAGTGIGYTGITSAKSYLEFEQNMKKVQAISGATSKEYQALEKEAIRLGATTKFTAGESAAAMEKMALAGFKTNQIIAAMGGVLDLAAASGEDVAMVSDIITDNLLPFKMAAEDTKRFADVLAWGMSKTNVTVEMLGESFKYASGSAGNLGVNLEEMVGTLGLMGDQAIKSGMAGRGMDSIFSELIKKKDILSRSEIGINIDNGKGEFVGLVKTVEQFEKFLKDKTDIERTAFLQNVFGEQGSRAFTKLLMAEKEINGITYKGAEAVAKTVEAARKDSIGMSEKMRDIMLEGASGTWTMFTSAVDGFRVTLGKLLLSDKVINIIKKTTNSISELTNVISGVFNDSKYNVFWQKIFSMTKNFIIKFIKALEPGIKVINRLFPVNELSETANRMFTLFENLAVFIASVFSKIMIIVEPFINFINFVGIDTITVFVGTLMTISKVLSVFAKLKAAIIFIKEIGGIVALLKTGLAVLGGPVTLIIGAVIAGLYIIYKHFDKIKAIAKIVLNFFIGIGQKIYNGFIKPIIDGFIKIKNKIVEVGKEILNAISHPIDTLKGLIKLPKPPNWVLKLFGKGEKNTVDGSHKSGLSYVPYDNYIARLHRGERVLTNEENKEYGSLLSGFNRTNLEKTSVSNNKKISFNFSPKIEIKVSGNVKPENIATILEKKIKELEEKFITLIEEREEEKNDNLRTSF